MPSTPSSPKARRRSSTQGSENYTVNNRRSRRISQHSPVSRRSSRLSNEEFPSGNDLISPNTIGDGLGSLADELANAWDAEEVVDEGTSDPIQSKPTCELASPVSPRIFRDLERTRDSGIDVDSLFEMRPRGTFSEKPQLRPDRELRQSDRKRTSNNDSRILSDQAEEDSSTVVGAHMCEVEKLTAYSTSSMDSTKHDDITRVTEALKTLVSQAEIESRTTRLITLHTSLAMHIAQQSRALQVLTYSLLSPLTPPPILDEINEILPMVIRSISMIPQPPAQALSSLTVFAETSREVVETLDRLSDTLHLSKQITSTATRKLRSTKVIVAQMQKETMASETGIRWIEDGEWERRLAERDCARVCRDVVGGFEQICQGYRANLIDKAGIVAA